MPIKINGVNHFAISVADLEESLAWYERVFGFRVLDRSEIPGTGVQVSHMQAPGFLLEVFCAPRLHPPAGGPEDPQPGFPHPGQQAHLLRRAGRPRPAAGV